MSADTHGFHYAFAALLQRQAWRLDAAFHTLAAATQQHRQHSDELVRMHRDCEALTWRPARHAGIDPRLQQARLDHLHRQRLAIAAQQHRLDELQHRQRQLQLECRREQARLDGLKAHRDRARRDFDSVQARRTAARLDQEVLARWSLRHVAQGAPT